MQSLPEHDNIKPSEIAKIVNELIRELQRQVGDIVMFGGSTIPVNYLTCDGTAISRTDYKLLYSVIGTAFGTGDGSTTFNLPDFRGVFPKGAGTTTRVAGVDASGNAYAATLGTYYQDKMQGHYHSTLIAQPLAGGTVTWNAPAASTTAAYIQTGAAVTDGTNGTPRTGHTTEPQSVGVNFIIKAR